MNIKSLISEINGVGPVIASRFNSININSIEDLLDYFPKRYNNYHNLVNIKDMQPGLVTAQGIFKNVSSRRVGRGLHITESDLCDDTGKVRVVWFNQPYRAKSLNNDMYLVQGNYGLHGKRLQIVNPSVEVYSQSLSDTQLILPTYSERSKLKSAQILKTIKSIFNNNINIPETLPLDIVNKYRLLSRQKAYQYIHIPTSDTELSNAKKRFAFEELYIAMMASNQMKAQNDSVLANKIKFKLSVAKEFIKKLPFELTADQKKVAWQIFKDIQTTAPMNRLVEGDVGSGKTVVASFASLMTLESNMQVAIVAPTELLAKQHYNTIKSLFKDTKHRDDIRLLVGSLKKSQKDKIHNDMINHKATCIIGTHAILQKNVKWSSLGLMIIDEQHRFGVRQRQALYNSNKTMPHILCMTATPIPRSLALTIYGELSISIIAKQPKNKAQIETKIISPNSTNQMYNAIKKQLNLGFQAYVVCPIIEDSSVLNVPSAQNTYLALKQKELLGYKIGLLHGKLKSEQKQEIMQKFINKELDVIVSTTVIEVGVDVPNATEMVILGADRFGLAQLHQLRGRVGRGKDTGYCYLVMSDSNKPSARMKALVASNDGFKLAEYDLKLRGPGAIYGARQHGELDLRFIELSDHKLIAEVRQAVDESGDVIKNLVKYTYLAQKIERALKLTYLN